MARPLFVPAILAGLLMATPTSSPGAARAGEQCIAGPKYAAPQGSHWYYRVDRASGRHCWYVGPAGAKVRSTGAKAQGPDRPTPSPAQTAAAGPPAAQNFFQAIATKDPGEDFSVRWPEHTQALAADPRPAPIGNSYADEPSKPDAPDDIPPTSALPTTDVASVPPAEAVGLATILTMLAGAALAALAAGLLLKQSAVQGTA